MTIIRKTLMPAALALSLISTGWAGHTYLASGYTGNVGFSKATAFAKVRDNSIDFDMWYPATPGGRAITVGGNGVFYGTPAGQDAPHRGGKYPLILISHGSGGNAGQFGWIASRLAENGFVVALPNHPGTTTGNASAAEAMKLWNRPPDLSAVIDAIKADPEAYPFVDTNRIATVGFSVGGYTSMAVSGALIEPSKLNTFCDDGKTGMSDCEFFKRAGINLHEIDFTPAAQSHKDERFKASVIVDPGIITTITRESLSAIDIPMLILNLGSDKTTPRGVYARDAAAIARADYQQIEDGLHFSFLAQCKPKGAKILADEGELDPLCEDRGGRSRADLHAEFAITIVNYLRRVLQSNQSLLQR